MSARVTDFLSRLSLRGRLGLLLSVMMFTSILFSALLLLEQHRIARRGAEIAIGAHQEMVNATQLRESLAEIDRYANLSEVNTHEIGRFRQLLADLEAMNTEEDAREAIRNLHDRFEIYASTLNGSYGRHSQLVRARYEDVAAAVGSLIAMDENFVYRMTDNLRHEQKRSMEGALAFLAAFILLIMLAGYKIISIIVSPLSSLVKFLDQINVEDDLPAHLPALKSEVPEVTSVTKSFEQVLQRLRGYRALNVHRLLIEKQQSDIISASIADGIFLLRDDELIYVNPTGRRILGLGSNEATQGLRLATVPGRKGVKAVTAAIASTIPVEFSLETEDRQFHYLVAASPISFDVIAQVQHSVSPVAQMLDRFQANTLVVARDVTIVKESQEAKGHFLATLSHEVKTPVTSLTMATRLLKKSLDQIPNLTHRNLILTCAEDVDRLRKLLEDLLTVTRFDTLTQNLQVQSVDFGRLMKHSVQSFQLQACERGVELAFVAVDSAKGPIMVSMDPSKITWAVSNLMTNALRHTPRGGAVQMEVEAMSERVEVRIRDNGPGIEKGRQERIFDKFNPFYDIRIARSGSAGVGLAIAREIVVAHGGRIWVSSEPGRGAEFCFTLPFSQRVSEQEFFQTKGATRGAPAGS